MVSQALQTKLGIKPNSEAVSLHAPKIYVNLCPGVLGKTSFSELGKNLEWIHAFYTDKGVLQSEINLLKDKLSTSGQLWISWPKKSSQANTDLSDEIVRAVGLGSGLVDVKIVSVNETWSALKFVYRIKDR